MASLRRRLAQACEHLACSTISRLQERVLHEPETFAELLQYLTIQVSDMYRDPEFFRAVRTQIVPILKTYPSVKVWVAGCSSGEEAYSFAILLQEEGLLERAILYATDINGRSLRTAESGIYELARMRHFTENHRRSGGRGSLSDYYHALGDSAVMDGALRKKITFSDHSLATDNVFSEVHLVSCRNVLIYFNPELRARALGLFDEALCSLGFLGLGSKESLRFSAVADRFTEYCAAERIYRKVPQV
jgi:chemotaxis protein methyltransferase CheR